MSLRLVLPDETIGVAYETPSGRDPLRWDHAGLTGGPVRPAVVAAHRRRADHIWRTHRSRTGGCRSCAYTRHIRRWSPAAGRSRSDQYRHAAFQALLAEHGDPVQGVIKAAVVAAVRSGRGPGGGLPAEDLPGRVTVAVTLRQLALTDGTSGALAEPLWPHRGPVRPRRVLSGTGSPVRLPTPTATARSSRSRSRGRVRRSPWCRPSAARRPRRSRNRSTSRS